jgi:hypothetical protein
MLMLFAVLVVGCAKSEPPAETSTSTETAAPAMMSLADVAGIWDGTVTRAGSDTVVATIELTATEDPTTWTMKVANAQNPAMQSTVSGLMVTAAGDSLVVEAPAFQSVLRAGQEVSTRMVYHMHDGNLMGTGMATYPSTGETLMLSTMATRRMPQ